MMERTIKAMEQVALSTGLLNKWRMNGQLLGMFSRFLHCARGWKQGTICTFYDSITSAFIWLIS